MALTEQKKNPEARNCVSCEVDETTAANEQDFGSIGFFVRWQKSRRRRKTKNFPIQLSYKAALWFFGISAVVGALIFAAVLALLTSDPTPMRILAVLLRISVRLASA
jgi:hypothetical protein